MSRFSIPAKFSVVFAAALVCGACTKPVTNGVRPAGSIVLSPDDAHIYVADTDNNQVVVANTASLTAEHTIAVGNNPERIQVGLDGRLYVSNRMDRSVSVIDPTTWTETTRIAVGTEPLGMSMTNDGKMLAVVNHTNNTVSIIDTASLTVTNTVQTPATYGPPVGVALVSASKMYVTHERRGESLPGGQGVQTAVVSIFDPTAGAELATSPVDTQLDTTQTLGDIREPGQPTDPVLFNGNLYFALAQSKQSPTPTPVGQPTDAYAGGTTPGSIPVVASGISSINVASDVKLRGQGLEQFGAGADGGLAVTTAFDSVPPAIMTTLNNEAMSGASSIAIEPGGTFLYMTNLNSGNVAILAVNGSTALLQQANTTGIASNGVLDLVQVGNGPKGIAIPASDDVAYVYNAFDETVSVIGSMSGDIAQVSSFTLSTSPLSPSLAHGRSLFFAADNAAMTNPEAGGIACASCHPNGRQDGRTWLFTEGPRNTPTLAGRHLAETAPYHWDGTLTDPLAFNEIVLDRMGGSGTGLTSTDFDDIFSYLESLPAPDNPNLNKDGTPVNAQAVASGQAIFMGTGLCATCHIPAQDFQDGIFHDVGTEGNESTPEGAVTQSFPMDVNTPPLNGLFYSAPYVHDGRYATLLDRLSDDPTGTNIHGATSTLTDAQKSDLVAYLNTL